MQLVRQPMEPSDPNLPEVGIRADRRTLAKRLWRAFAEDGAEFGFEVGEPLRDGQTVWADAGARYVIRQAPEPVLEIPCGGPAHAAALLGWTAGNLHLPLQALPEMLLVPDEPAMRQALERLGASFRPAVRVFNPHRMAAHSHSH